MFVVASSCFPFVRVLGVALGFNVMPLGPGKYLVTVVVVVVLLLLLGSSNGNGFSNNNGSAFFLRFLHL